MGNCTITKFNGTLNGYNEDGDYFGKGMLIFDNSITPTQTSVTNSIYSFVPNNDVVCLDSITINTLNGATISTSTSANTKSRFLYPLYSTTAIGGIGGSGYNSVVGNFKLRMKDVLRCSELADFMPTGLSMVDSYDLESLAVLTKLSFIRLNGGTAGNWSVDLVNLADGQIENGREVSNYPVLILQTSKLFDTSKMKVNGQPMDSSSNSNYYHIVFGASGYSIYLTTSSTPLADYSGLTPVYTK